MLFRVEHIHKGSCSRTSGHKTYRQAAYIYPNSTIAPHYLIYKENKYGQADLSLLEVMFGQLAKLFLFSGLTATNHLVINKFNEIQGLAVQHLGYVIAEKEGLNANFYKKKRILNRNTAPKKIDYPTEIPIYFMDKLPQGFFARLMEARDDVSIDYASLASILATSYTLEEDDLHRGNYGFYLVERENKIHVVFFKIDHDLMFVDSIMGFKTSRPFHLIHGAHAFAITPKDLNSLVNLYDSSNSYWPSKFGYLANPFANKENHSYADIQAFSDLTMNPKFIQTKWMAFLKHILIPDEIIEQTLKECINKEKASDRAALALVLQSLKARRAQLRAVLFSLKEFRHFVADLNSLPAQELLNEIISPHLRTGPIMEQARSTLNFYQNLCTKEGGFEEGDTPLHTAIKLGEYRYEDSVSTSGQFINKKNKVGKTPLDIVLEHIGTGSSDEGDVQKNSKLILKNLIDNGAKKTKRYNDSGIEKIMDSYIYKNPYLDDITFNMSYSSFKTILKTIGEDHRFCLKAKKNLAKEGIQTFWRICRITKLLCRYL